jgi:hypothetical protein
MSCGVDSIYTLVIDRDAVTTQEHVQSPVAEASALGRKLLQTLLQNVIIREFKHAAERLRIAGCDGAGSPLAKPDLVYHRPSSSSPLRGR